MDLDLIPREIFENLLEPRLKKLGKHLQFVAAQHSDAQQSQEFFQQEITKTYAELVEATQEALSQSVGLTTPKPPLNTATPAAKKPRIPTDVEPLYKEVLLAQTAFAQQRKSDPTKTRPLALALDNKASALAIALQQHARQTPAPSSKK
jgi:hypothetical protein